MNKLKLITYLLLCAAIIQGCKKDPETGVAYTTAAFQANIDGATWAPASDSLSTSITYNSATKTKVLNCIGTAQQKQIIMTITLTNTDNSNNFTIGTFNVDSVNVTIQYNTQQKNSSGNYVFVPHGTVSSGSGSIIITAIDPAKKTLTGTFSFLSRSTTYDSSGKVISVTVDNITAGEFTGIPYTFSSN